MSGAVGVVVIVVVAGVLPLPTGHLLADITGLLGAAVATGLFALSARRESSPALWLMTLGLAGWCAGQGLWTWHRSIGGRAMPFVNVENALFLALPCCAGAALIVAARQRRGGHPPEPPTRVLVLDAALLCLGVLGLTWESTIGAVAARTEKSVIDVALASLYTVSDLALITLTVVLALGLRQMWRRSLLWLLAGLFCIGFSDAVYAYAVSADQIAPVWADSGYMSGPWLVAVAAGTRDRPFRRSEAVSLSMLPYVPVAGALGLTVAHTLINAHRPTRGETYVLVALLCLVTARHFIAQQRLATAHLSLIHHARTDALTATANRAGLEAAYARRDHDHRHDELGIVLCDLDQFKPINDAHGHATGDSVLQVIATRLQRCVRNTDLVARLGGDEFVLLLDPAPANPAAITARIANGIAVPIVLDGRTHRVTASTGYSIARAGDQLIDVLAAADHQMYQAKATRHEALRLS